MDPVEGAGGDGTRFIFLEDGFCDAAALCRGADGGANHGDFEEGGWVGGGVDGDVDCTGHSWGNAGVDNFLLVEGLAEFIL